MKKRFRLLEVISTLPYPIRAGGTQALFCMIDGLRRYVDITIALNLPKGKEQDLEDLQKIWPDVSFCIFRQKKDLGYYVAWGCKKRLVSYLVGDKRLSSLHSPSLMYSADWLQFIQNVIEQIKPDIVQTEFYPGQDLVYAFPKQVKKVFVQHEIHYSVNESWLKSNGYWESGVVRTTYNRMKAEELAAMNSYDAVLTLNETDKIVLEQEGITTTVYSSPVSVISAPQRNECRFDGKLLFIGAGGHPPNEEGVNWFIQKVWPVVTKKYPDIQFHIVGEWNDLQKASFLQYDNVFFDGFVPSLQDAFRGVIAVVPIVSGSGIRMKILDAVNFGAPFVSTELGALGMGFEDGRDCFIATTPEEFADKLIRLIEEEGLRSQFYMNSYKVYCEKYTQEAVVKRRMRIYEEILS